jgi:hypothetical protein
MFKKGKNPEITSLRVQTHGISPSVRILLVSKPKILALSTRLYQVKLLSVHLSPRMTGQPPSCSSMSRASLLLLCSMYASSIQLLYSCLEAKQHIYIFCKKYYYNKKLLVLPHRLKYPRFCWLHELLLENFPKTQI